MGEFELKILTPQQGNFLQRIEWNRKEFDKRVKEIADKYRGELQIGSDADKKRAKDDRATINSMLKEIDDRRKAVKAAIMEPYDIFEGEVKESTESLTFVRDSIDDQIKAYEEKASRAKLQTIYDHWEQHEKRPQVKCALADLTDWERIQNPKWKNATYTVKKACEEIDACFDKAMADLKTIEGLDEERPVKQVMTEKLVETGDIREALAMQARIHERERRRREEKEAEERRIREAEQAKAAQRRAAEDAAHQDRVQASTHDKLEALRARLSPAEPPKAGGQGNGPEQQQNAPTGPQSGQEVPAAGYVRDSRPVGGPADAGTADHDAQSGQGRAEAAGPQPPEEKIIKVAFWVAGTKTQLKGLGEHIKGLCLAGYGMLKGGS